MAQGYGAPPPGYGQGNGPGRALEHPSANTALLLGLAGIFCLGPFTGVPAILMGRSVVRTTELEPQRWNGGGTAKVAMVLGWISVFETSFVATILLANNVSFLSPSLGIGVGLLGLVLVGVSGINALPLRALRSARLVLGVPLGGVVVASALSLYLSSIPSAAAVADAKRCLNARSQYSVSLKSESFDTARTNVSDVEHYCKATGSELATLRAEIDSKEADVASRKVQELAQVAAKAEKNAVDTFPAESKEIATLIKSAQSKAGAGKWEDSEFSLNEAQSKLNSFKGTSVEQSKDFISLSAQIAQQQKTLEPKLDAIHRKELDAIYEANPKETAAQALTAQGTQSNDTASCAGAPADDVTFRVINCGHLIRDRYPSADMPNLTANDVVHWGSCSMKWADHFGTNSGDHNFECIFEPGKGTLLNVF